MNLRWPISIDWKSTYVKNLSITGLGTGLGVIINLITAPILSRVFTPEAYGIAGLYTNILSYVSLIGGLMLSTGIVVVRQPRQLYLLIGGLKFLWGIGFVLVSLLIIVFGGQFQRFLNDISNGIWLWLLPIGFLLGKVTEMINALNVRAAQFTLNVKVNLSNSLLVRASSIGMGYWSGGNYLAIVGSSLVNIFLTVVLQTKSSILKIIAIPASWQSLRYTLKKLSHYPRYLLPGNLLSLFSLTAPFLIFSVFHSPALAGVYLFTDNMLLVPFRLANKAITPVYLQKISKLFHDAPDQFRQLTVMTNHTLFLVGMVPYALLTVWGPQIFMFVFGETWREGGVMAQYLAFFVLFRMSTSPLSSIYRVAEEERTSLITQVVLFFSRIVPLAIGLYWFSLHQALLLFGLGSLLGYFFHYYQLCRIGKLPFLSTVLLQSGIFTALCGLFWGISSLF